MTFDEGRELVLQALKEIDAMDKSNEDPTGNFFGHLEIQVAISIMGNTPFILHAEDFVATDNPNELVTKVKDRYDKMSDSDMLFTSMAHAINKEGEYNGDDTGDDTEDDKEEGYEQG